MSEVQPNASISPETARAVNAIRAKKNVRYWCPIERKAMNGRGGRHTCPDCGGALMLGGQRGGRPKR